MLQIKDLANQEVLLEVKSDNLIGHDLQNARLENACLKSMDLSRICLQSADLTAADLSSSQLVQARMSGANLSRAVLAYSDLTSADLSHAVLRDANLQHAILRGAKLGGAEIQGADLRDADLSMSDARANFNRANLSGCNLRGANLAWANLQAADLTDADLTGANTTGANFAGANLRGATLPAEADIADRKQSGSNERDRNKTDKQTSAAKAAAGQRSRSRPAAAPNGGEESARRMGRSATAPSFVCPECGFRDPHPVRLPGGRICCRACQFVPQASVKDLAHECLKQLRLKGDAGRTPIGTICLTLGTLALICFLFVRWLQSTPLPSKLEDRAQWIVQCFLDNSFERLSRVCPPDSEAAIEAWKQRRPTRWDMVKDPKPPKMVATINKSSPTSTMVSVNVIVPGGETYNLGIPFTRQDEEHDWQFDIATFLKKSPKKY